MSIVLDQVTKRYQEQPVVNDVSLEVGEGEFFVLLGPSGSGKSTLLRLLALEERPTAGQLTINGQNAIGAPVRTLRRLRRRSIAVVLQRPTLNLFPQLTAHEHVELAALWRGAAKSDIDEALDTVGLSQRKSNRPDQLSGGEQQRLAVAMAGIGRPTVLLADEPTAELDAESAAAVIAHLRASADTGVAVVVNTHDPAVAAAADRVLALHHGTLHSERLSGRASVAVIDAVGRVQLPPDLLAVFPGNRAEITLQDGTVVLRPVSDGNDE